MQWEHLTDVERTCLGVAFARCDNTLNQHQHAPPQHPVNTNAPSNSLQTHTPFNDVCAGGMRQRRAACRAHGQMGRFGTKTH